MSLETEWIRYGNNGEYSGYAARLQDVKEPLPAVIVLQEIWGVDDHIQDITRRLALTLDMQPSHRICLPETVKDQSR